MNGQQIVDAVVNEGGFDTSSTGMSRATVAGWVAERYRDMVVRARWYMQMKSLGSTEAGVATYYLDDGIAEVDVLRVGQRRWDRQGVEQVFDLQSGDLFLSAGVPGVFSPWWDDTGRAGVELYPAPSEGGQEIVALCAMQPPDFQDAASFIPIVPADFHRKLVDGPVADGLRLIDERLGDADVFEQRHEASVVALRMRKNSQIGSGPVQLDISRRPRR